MSKIYAGANKFFQMLNENGLDIPYDGPVYTWVYYCQHKARPIVDHPYAVFNTENLTFKLLPEYRKFLDDADVVFDFSKKNKKFYPKGKYHPIEIKKDIEYLFYGTPSERRNKIINKLNAHYLKGVWGWDLQPYILRAKYVLVISLNGDKLSDPVRVSQAVMMGGHCLVEKSEKHFDNYLKQFPQVEVLTYKQILNHKL